MAKVKAPKTYSHHCNQCGRDWTSKLKHPKHCASCISDKWDKPLVGKRLRKPVASRALAGVAKNKRRRHKLSPKNVADLKKRMKAQRAAAQPAKVKAPRAPRVKKEKGITPEQFDKKATEA